MTVVVIPSECEESHAITLTWREILQGVAFQNDSYVIPSECEESRHLAEMLRWRSAWHYYSEALSWESHVTVAWVEISQGRVFQNDGHVIPSVYEESRVTTAWKEILPLLRLSEWQFLLLLSRRKEVTKKGRPLVIGYSCLPLRSPTGAAELAPLKQSSPYFRLLPRSRQPDKGGHFSSPTLPAIKGKGGSLLSFRARAIARRGIPCFYSQHSNCTLAWWEILRCSIPLNDKQRTITLCMRFFLSVIVRMTSAW